MDFARPLSEFMLADGLLQVIRAENFGNGREASQALEGLLRVRDIAVAKPVRHFEHQAFKAMGIPYPSVIA